MNKKKNEQKTALSITSFILSLIGLLLSLSIIGAIVGIPLALIGLIFGIIALIKKQKKGLAIAGVVIGGLVTLITILVAIIGTIFVKNNKEFILEPIQEFANTIDNDDELKNLMNNPAFQKEFEKMFENRIIEQFSGEENLETRDEVKVKIPVIFDEMKEVMLELKEKNISE